MFLGLEPIHIVMIIVAIIALVSAWGTFFFKPKVPVNTEMQTINKSLKDLSDENARLKETYKCEFEDANKKYIESKKRIEELESVVAKNTDKLNEMYKKITHLVSIDAKYWKLIKYAKETFHIFEKLEIKPPGLDADVVYDIKNYKENGEYEE